MVCSDNFMTSLDPERLHLHWSLLSFIHVSKKDDLQIAVIIIFNISLLDPKDFVLDWRGVFL